MEGGSLEPNDTEVVDMQPMPDAARVTGSLISPETQEPPQKPKRQIHWRLIGLIALVVLGILVGATSLFLAFRKTPAPAKRATNITINTQSLDNGTLNKIAAKGGSDSTVNQQLTINPSTLFKNDVAVQGSVIINKNLQVNGHTTLQNGVTITGNTTITGNLTANNASLGGNLTVSGQISALSLNVGSLTISSVNLSGDLDFAGHIVPSGHAPSAKASVAAGGGSVSIEGNDTAGSVTINVGNSPATGELVIISFQHAFNTTPHVQLTPVNAAGASLQYFATQSPTFFSVNSANKPAAGSTLVFNYLVSQ